MYTIIRRNYPNIGVSWHGIRKIYEKCEWLNAPPKRKAQPQQRCRYQAVYPNQIWHVDIHIWSKYTGLYIFGVIDEHTHTVCVPYYKAAPYNISHTKIFSRAKYNRVI